MKVTAMIAMVLIATTSLTEAATPSAKKKKHSPLKQQQKAAPAAPAEQGAAVKVFAPRFVEPGHVYPLRTPMIVKVNADDAVALSRVRVRVFPNKDPQTLKRTYLEVTQSGCRILGSRVESYMPSFERPDIRLEQIYAHDMRCDATGKFLEATPFVLVVESDDGDDNRFLRIEPTVVDAYFRKVYFFTVKPEPRQPCSSIPVAREAMDASPPSDAGVLTRQETAAEHDANRNSCVKRVM
jgi:hypothetical protein